MARWLQSMYEASTYPGVRACLTGKGRRCPQMCSPDWKASCVERNPLWSFLMTTTVAIMYSRNCEPTSDSSHPRQLSPRSVPQIRSVSAGAKLRLDGPPHHSPTALLVLSPFIISDSAFRRISHCKDTTCSTFSAIYDERTCAGHCVPRMQARRPYSWAG